jgi:hypothetical protein
MVRPLPIEVQNSIKLLLIIDNSYPVIQKIYPNVGLSSLYLYKKEFLGGFTSPKVEKQTRISTQTQN